MYEVCIGGAHKSICAHVQECLHKCLCVSVSWNVQPLPLNRKAVQLIASPPFPLVQNGGQTRRTSTVSQSDPEPFSQGNFSEIFLKFAVYKAPGRMKMKMVNLSI